MTRLPDWPTRYAAFVAERRDTPFAWGVNDCALLAADCVQAITGVDVSDGLRQHRNAAQAVAVVTELGGLAAIATRALGEPVPAAFAGVGDVVLIDVDGRESLGVCNGGTVFGPGAAGLAVLGMTATHCWKVGHA